MNTNRISKHLCLFIAVFVHSGACANPSDKAPDPSSHVSKIDLIQTNLTNLGQPDDDHKTNHHHSKVDLPSSEAPIAGTGSTDRSVKRPNLVNLPRKESVSNDPISTTKPPNHPSKHSPTPIDKTCLTDRDCRAQADYCTGCDCIAMTSKQIPEKCQNQADCIQNPCSDAIAKCHKGNCTLLMVDGE